MKKRHSAVGAGAGIADSTKSGKTRSWPSWFAMTFSVLALLASAGCFSPGGSFGSKVSSEQKAGIIAGKTTMTDVLRDLGNPDQKIDLGNNQEQFSYITANLQQGFYAPPPFGSVGLKNTEFWILFENKIVKESGERPTTKSPSSPYPTSR